MKNDHIVNQERKKKELQGCNKMIASNVRMLGYTIELICLIE